MNKYKPGKQIASRGISLLELMLSLTIITIFLIAATRYYQTTQTSRKVSNVVQSLQAIYSAEQKYSMDNSNLPAAGEIINTFISNGLLPSNFTVFANPWGIIIDSISDNKVQVTFKNVPIEACNNIDTKITANFDPDEIDISCTTAPGATYMVATF